MTTHGSLPAKHLLRLWLFIFLGLALVRGLLYVALIPPWQAPDETGHFEYVWLLVNQERLPTAETLSPTFESELLSSLYAWRYGEYTQRPLPEIMPARLAELPPDSFARNARTVMIERFSLAYLWAAPFLYLVRHQELITQLYFARLASVVLYTLNVWLAYRLFQALLPHRPRVALALTAVYSFIPQHTYINSMVGDGPLAELMALAVLYSWVRIFQHGISPVRLIAVIAGTLLGIASKTTAAFLIPLDLLFGLWWWLQNRQRPLQRRALIGLVLGALILLGGLWLWSHTTLGMRTLDRLTTLSPTFAESGILLRDKRGLTLPDALLLTFQSAWANFGWMRVPVSDRWYGALLLLTIAGLAGWLLPQENCTATLHRGAPQLAVACLLAMGSFVTIALIGRQDGGYYQFQGRYLFPILAPTIYFWVTGLQRYVRPRVELLTLAALIGFLIAFDVWSLIQYIVPYFYG